MGSVRFAATVVAMTCGVATYGLAATTNIIPLPRPSPFRTVAPAPVRPTPVSSGPVSNGDTQRALVDRVNAYLSNIQTMVGDFVQIGPDGKRSEGQFYLQKPGKVRFAYDPPSPIDVIADGQSVVVRNRVLATQDPYPLSQTPLRFLLSNHLDLSKDTNLVSVSADDSLVTLVIEERHLLIGTHRLKLIFGAKDFQLRQWTVTDPQGFDTTVSIYNLDTSKKLDPNMFKITYERNMQ
jgi:outer membrane lipoprotein-sorting protein